MGLLTWQNPAVAQTFGLLCERGPAAGNISLAPFISDDSLDSNVYAFAHMNLLHKPASVKIHSLNN